MLAPQHLARPCGEARPGRKTLGGSPERRQLRTQGNEHVENAEMMRKNMCLSYNIYIYISLYTSYVDFYHISEISEIDTYEES